MLTAYNEDVQKYIEAPNKAAKNEIIKEVKETALANGINFNALFPKGTKRYQVFDTLVYLLSVGGICTISSTKLAEKAGAKTSTVYEAVKYLKELGMFLVCGLADGKNKYVFVYKNHRDFREILVNVFYADFEVIQEETEGLVFDQNEEQNGEQTEEHQNAESVESQGIDGDKTDPIHNISFIFKQESNIYKQAIQNEIENELLEVQNDELKEYERVATYAVNEYQTKFYHHIKAGDYHEEIRNNASILGLRLGNMATKEMYIIAMKSVIKIDKSLRAGRTTIRESITAIFDRVYTDGIKQSLRKKPKGQALETVEKKKALPFYNWLNTERKQHVSLYEYREQNKERIEELDELELY